mmetsp:Transcript_48843/g.147159  ORF Transcript_48843/g.147159 Transcript_48843/m.147159 type:complete len:701 (-) Transcript_48843:458-2560(-)
MSATGSGTRGSNSNDKSSSRAAVFAKRRLLRDLKEIQSHEAEALKTVSALPTSNIFEWRCNIRPDEGSYSGTVFHFVLRFKETYPHSPPIVYMCTFIDHPNVFGEADYFNWEHPYICLDMLQDYYTDEPFVGWTSAYSVMSLLLQLQSFFFEENAIPQDFGRFLSATNSARSFTRAIREACEFSCEIDTCDGEVTHTQREPWPPLPKYTGKMSPFRGLVFEPRRCNAKDSKVIVAFDHLFQETSQVNHSFLLSSPEFPALSDSNHAAASIFGPPPSLRSELPSSSTTASLPDLPTHVAAHLFTFLPHPELLRVRNVCAYWRTVVTSFNLIDRPQMMCFHSKVNMDDPDCVLGIGIKVQYYHDGNLKNASSPLDMLSIEAYEKEHVRNGVWGGKRDKFNNFLPFIINNGHAQKSAPLIEQAVFRVMKRVPFLPTHHFKSIARPTPVTFKPPMMLQLLAVLMNTMVVQLMECAGTQTCQRQIRRHASEKALEGYCAFHHMLLHFAEKYPSIKNVASRQIEKFIKRERSRHKRETPNLGALLVCLTLSERKWEDLWQPLLHETFDRNVRWLLDKYPELSDVDGLDDNERLEKSFLGTRTSLRLLMFQVHFIASIGRPVGMDCPSKVIARYEQNLGKPTTAQKEDLQSACKTILRVNNWPEFFERLGVPVPTKERLVEVLRTPVTNSEKKRYHKRRNHKFPRPA